MNLLFNRLVIFSLLLITGCVEADELIKLEKVLGAKIKSYEKSAVFGFSRVVTEKGIIYVSDDNRYFFVGKLFKIMNDNKLVDLTRKYMDTTRKLEIQKLADSAILFKSKNERYIVDVFIDVDCVFCKKMHKNIDNYLRLGISLRYYAKPGGGIGSDSFQKLNSIWCSDNQRHKINLAMAGISPKYINCNSVVAEHYKMAKELNIDGTPIFVLNNGSRIIGYQSPNDLLKLLN